MLLSTALRQHPRLHRRVNATQQNLMKNSKLPDTIKVIKHKMQQNLCNKFNVNDNNNNRLNATTAQ